MQRDRHGGELWPSKGRSWHKTGERQEENPEGMEAWVWPGWGRGVSWKEDKGPGEGWGQTKSLCVTVCGCARAGICECQGIYAMGKVITTTCVWAMASMHT